MRDATARGRGGAGRGGAEPPWGPARGSPLPRRRCQAPRARRNWARPSEFFEDTRTHRSGGTAFWDPLTHLRGSGEGPTWSASQKPEAEADVSCSGLSFFGPQETAKGAKCPEPEPEIS